ncbi:Actin-associated protein, partial [Dissostichus eleginoides]
KAYSIRQEPRGKHPNGKERRRRSSSREEGFRLCRSLFLSGQMEGLSSGERMVKSASAYADLHQHRFDDVQRREVPAPDYQKGDEDEDLIKPKKLLNPVKASRSHQELHRELMSSCKR